MCWYGHSLVQKRIAESNKIDYLNQKRKNEMQNYKFYTPPMLAECLINLLPSKEYNQVIDICCGSQNLLKAAKKRFVCAHYVGGDIDANVKEYCFTGADFYCEEGRQ